MHWLVVQVLSSDTNILERDRSASSGGGRLYCCIVLGVDMIQFVVYKELKK